MEKREINREREQASIKNVSNYLFACDHGGTGGVYKI
jgi:hypothetical protein